MQNAAAHCPSLPLPVSVYERVRGVRMCMCICVPPLLDVFSILSLGK